MHSPQHSIYTISPTFVPPLKWTAPTHLLLANGQHQHSSYWQIETDFSRQHTSTN